jgi:hypothetical protein
MNPNSGLRRTAFRAFIGSCVTLTSSVANLITLTVLRGEPGYICLMCCNADSECCFSIVGYVLTSMIVLFSVIVLHWMTCRDQDPSPPTTKKPEASPSHPEFVSIAPSGRPTSLGTFDLEGTAGILGTGKTQSTRDGHGLTSVVVSEETSGGHKGPSNNENVALSDMSQGGITMRTSLTMESTRDDDSLYDKANS